MKIRSLLSAIGFGLLSALPGFPSAQAAVYTSGHGDIGVEYLPGTAEFAPHWHLIAGAVVDGVPLVGEAEYEPGEMVARVRGKGSVSGAAAAALGVAPGSLVWRTGSSAYPPNLGFGLEEVGDETDWLEGTITLTLGHVSGPGAVALGQTIPGFGSFLWFASDPDATAMGNRWESGVGSHGHLDWYFSRPGSYAFEWTWSGVYLGGGVPVNVTGTGTFHVEVVPEPGSWGLLGGGLAVAALLGRRARRRAV